MTYITCPHCKNVILKKGKRYLKPEDQEKAKQWVGRKPETGGGPW